MFYISGFKVCFILILFLIHEKQSVPLSQTAPSFRIISPQNICRRDKNETRNFVPEGVSISFQPLDGLKFSYKFRIFFKGLSTESFTQRETLLIWKTVRQIEQRINIKDRLQIANENVLHLNQSEMVPGVKYIFHVIGVTNSGETTKEHIFSIKYPDVNSELKATERTNLILVGSSTAVSSSSLYFYAKVSFCAQPLNYYIDWRVYGLSEENQELQRTIGTTLILPPYSLSVGDNVILEANVIILNSSEPVVKDSIEVKVGSRGFEAYIIPSFAKIGVGSSAKFQIFIRNFDCDPNNIEISWEYMEINEQILRKEDNQNNNILNITFQNSGRYQIRAYVKEADMTTELVADVEVISNIFVSYDFAYSPNMDPAPNIPYEFTVMVLGLTPRCKAGWICVQEDGYKFISPNDIGKHNFGEYETSNLEETFLSEIADIERHTTNKEVTLYIPIGNAGERWKGLEGDGRYKFRLDVLCSNENANENIDSKSALSSQFEFIIHTNSPPTVNTLYVNPLKGFALETVFTISIGEAKDLLLDTPLSFELCATFDQFNTCFGLYYEYKSWEITLPFTGAKIELYANICDIRSACVRTTRTDIVVELPRRASEKQIWYKERIISAFLRTDYVEGLNNMLIASVTYKNMKSHLFEEMGEFIKALLEKEINKILERSNNKIYIPPENIIKFVLLSQINLEAINVNDSEIFENLLELLENYSPARIFSIQSTDETPQTQIRFKRLANLHLNQEYHTLNALYAKTMLLVIESITKSKQFSVKKHDTILNHVNTLVERLCHSNDIRREIFDTSFVSIKLEKYPGSYILQKIFSIPPAYTKNEGHFKIELTNLSDIKNNELYCIGVIQYNSDYLTNEDQPVVGLKILALDESNSENEIVNFVVHLEMPKKHNDETTCLLYEEKKWSSTHCNVKRIKSSHVLCACSKLGYFRLTNNTDASIVATSNITKPISTTIAAPDKFKGITSAMPFTTGLLSTNPVTLKAKPTSQQDQQKSHNQNQTNHQNITGLQKASTWTYVLPITGFLLIAIILIICIAFHRRHRQKSRNLVINDFNITLKARQKRTGVKYAAIHDWHIMHGNM